MRRLKVILEEDGSSREISYVPTDILRSLNPDKKYDFSLTTGSGRDLVEFSSISPDEIALLIPGVVGRVNFTERHCEYADKRLKEGYLVRIREVA